MGKARLTVRDSENVSYLVIGQSLAQTALDIEALIKAYGEKAFLDRDFNDGNTTRIYFDRQETDAEYARRQRKELSQRKQLAEKKAKRDEKERAEYQRLAAKYGKVQDA